MRSHVVTVLIVVGLVKGGIGATCPNGVTITKSGLSDSDKQAVTDAHNKLRLDIANGRVSGQPKGIDLKRLQYDDVLGQKAQVVSNTCQMQHITATDSRWSWVGQNLFMSFSSVNDNGVPDWDAAVRNWFSENKDFIYPNTSNGVTGHYTQVVWAATTHIGCDFAYFKDSATNMWAKLYTCNYGTGGNVGSQAPYQTGTSGCSNLC